MSSIGATLPGTEVGVQFVIDATGIPVIYVSGELDLSNVDAFRAGIDPVFTPTPERVVFDFKDLRFMDSSAVALLVQLSTHVCPVEVRNPTRTVRKVIEVTGLADIFHLDS